jgi:hypothetical protein
MKTVQAPYGNSTAGSRRLLGKLALDLVMMLLIILEYAYDFTGGIVHEAIGISLLALFVVHAVINRKWFVVFFKGKYGLKRAVNTAVNLLVLGVALVLLCSGLLNASLIEMLLNFKWAFSTRGVHSVAGYWLLLLMAAHLGMHWTVILSECRRRLGWFGNPKWTEVFLLRIAALAILVYGGFAAVRQDILSRLLADYSFSYWDDSAVVSYFIDFIALVGAMTVLVHYFRACLWSRRSS